MVWGFNVVGRLVGIEGGGMVVFFGVEGLFYYGIGFVFVVRFLYIVVGIF